MDTSPLSPPGALSPPDVTPAAYRLCVAFIDCPTVAKGAANYLILTQNRVQNQFEFDVFDLDRMRAELGKDENATFMETDEERAVVAPLDPKVPIRTYGDERAGPAVDLATRWIDSEVRHNPVPDGSIPASWVVFTEKEFTDKYYSAMVGDDIMLVSIGYWRTWMAPPSALEFIVRTTQAACARFFLGLPVHYMTKGCVRDYNQYLEDTRLMVLVGSLCDTCQQRATEAAKSTELEALLALLDKGWVGDMTSSTSVASVLKKVYDYDLYVTRGVSVNRLETFWDNVSSSSAQEFVRVVFAIVLAFLLLKFGLKGGG